MMASSAFSVTQAEAAGNPQTASAVTTSFVLDATPPTVPSIALGRDTGNGVIANTNSDGITSDRTINVHGLESGASWRYQIDGGVWMNGTASSFNAIDGQHSYKVQQSDENGNSSAISIAMLYTLDTVVLTPTLGLMRDTGNGVIANTNSDGITSDRTINVYGLESGALWQYQIDGGVWMSGTGNSFLIATGEQEAWQPVISLDGSIDPNQYNGYQRGIRHTYSVRQIDVAGNSSVASSGVQFVLDEIGPGSISVNVGNQEIVLGDNGVDNGLEYGDIFAYQIIPKQSNTPLLELEVNRNNSIFITDSSIVSISISNLGVGSWSMLCATVDIVGNWSDFWERTISILP